MEFNPLMRSGNKGSCILKKSCRQTLQVCLNIYDFLILTVIKELKTTYLVMENSSGKRTS